VKRDTSSNVENWPSGKRSTTLSFPRISESASWPIPERYLKEEAERGLDIGEVGVAVGVVGEAAGVAGVVVE